MGPGNPIGEVESTKSVSDVYAPVAGTVAAVNTVLADAPETINADPYGDGWLVEISVAGDGGRPDGAPARRRRLRGAGRCVLIGLPMGCPAGGITMLARDAGSPATAGRDRSTP